MCVPTYRPYTGELTGGFMNLGLPFPYKHIQPITAGWSLDRKYMVILSDDTKAVLRLSPKETNAHKTQLLSYLKLLEHLPVPKVFEHGITADNKYFYVLLSWVEGEVLNDRITHLPNALQYQLGLEAGQILRQIHSVPVKTPEISWEESYFKKLSRTLDRYRKCGVRIKEEKVLLDVIDRFTDCLKGRPYVFQHGDFHVGNFLLTPEHTLVVIDFDRSSIGDPFEEFDRLIWSYQKSPLFASGQLHGYFDGEPPEQFFKLLAVYNARGAFSGIAWSLDFGEDDRRTIEKNIDRLLADHDYFNAIIPRWYIPQSLV